jgi:hypothetical protein
MGIGIVLKRHVLHGFGVGIAHAIEVNTYTDEEEDENHERQAHPDVGAFKPSQHFINHLLNPE